MKTFLSIMILALTISVTAATSLRADDYSDYPAWAAEAFIDADDRGSDD